MATSRQAEKAMHGINQQPRLLLLLHNHHHHSQPSVWAYTPRKVMAIDREAAEERLLATGNGVLHRVHSFWSNFAGK